MTRSLTCLLPLLLSSILLVPLARADDQAAAASAASRMRDALRSTMQQLNDAQNQVATLEAAQAQSAQQLADLQNKLDAANAQIKTVSDKASADQSAAAAKLAELKRSHQALMTEMVDTLTLQINSLNKQGTDDKTLLQKSVADMKSKDDEMQKVLDTYGSDIQMWKDGYNQYVRFANQTEATRQQLAVQNIMLHRLVDDRETKNLQLYSTATEILDRYEKFSLGDALAAKEPFAGLARVKLQEQVQDYKDKLVDEKVRIGQSSPEMADASSSSTQSSRDTTRTAETKP